MEAKETREINLNTIDSLFNPTLGDDKEIGEGEIKAIYTILIEMLPEDDMLLLIGVLQSFREDSEYVKKILIEDSKSNKIFFQKISKALSEQNNYKSIVVYNSVLNTESVEYQQYFYDELNNLKIVLQEIIKETIFKLKKEEIDTSLNKTLAILIQQLTKTLNLVITKKGKALFCDGNIKETLLAITELITKSNSASIPREQRDQTTEIINTEIVENGMRLQIHENQDDESIAKIVRATQSDMMRAFQKVMSETIKEAVKEAVSGIEEATAKNITDSTESLKNLLIRDNDERFKSQAANLENAFNEMEKKEAEIEEKVDAVSRKIEEVKEINESAKDIIEKHVEEQDRILDKYREKLNEAKRYE